MKKADEGDFVREYAPSSPEKKKVETVELVDFDAAGNPSGTIEVDPAVGRETPEPMGTVPYIDPVKLNDVANQEAKVAPGVDDPDGPEAVRQWSGLQTHDFGGIPFHRADVVTYDPAKERARMRREQG